MVRRSRVTVSQSLIPGGTPRSGSSSLKSHSSPPHYSIRCCVSHGLDVRILRELIAEGTREHGTSSIVVRVRKGEIGRYVCIIATGARSGIRSATGSGAPFSGGPRKRCCKNAKCRP